MNADRRFARLSLAPVLALLLAVPGCRGGGGTPAGPSLDVTVKDFHIQPAQPTVGVGDITFRVTNQGPATHEFVVIRSDLADDKLPIGPDGLSVDEDSVDRVGEIGEVGSGATETLTLDLDPGRYVVFCNLEGHYLGGMHASVEVS